MAPGARGAEGPAAEPPPAAAAPAGALKEKRGCGPTGQSRSPRPRSPHCRGLTGLGAAPRPESPRWHGPTGLHPSLGWSQGVQGLLMDIIQPPRRLRRGGPLLRVIIIFTRAGWLLAWFLPSEWHLPPPVWSHGGRSPACPVLSAAPTPAAPCSPDVAHLGPVCQLPAVGGFVPPADVPGVLPEQAYVVGCVTRVPQSVPQVFPGARRGFHCLQAHGGLRGDLNGGLGPARG